MAEEIPVDGREQQGKNIYLDHDIEVCKLSRKAVKKA